MVYTVTSDRVVLLGGYPAKQCAYRSYLEHDPTVPRSPEPDAVQRRMAEGRVFEDEVVAYMVAALGERCVSIEYGDHRGDKARRIAETNAAMEAGVEVIIGGQLPDDTVGGRTGSPDVLIRWSWSRTDGARYVPADIKHHHTLKPASRTAVRVSGPSPYTAAIPEVAGYTHMTSHRASDSIQLAHYTRMLQAIDRHPGDRSLVGGILGTTDFTDLTGDRFGFVWYDLTAVTEKTWSGTADAGWRKRSILDVYDHEVALRQQVAQAARAGEPALVRAFGKAECGECPFYDWCKEQAGPEDASFTISKGQVTDREWRYLHAHGYGTITALASAPVNDNDFRAGYARAAAHLPTPGKRLDDLARRARMHRDGIAFERTGTGILTVPTADVEIDFDVEWHPADGHVYQWGARVRYGSDEATATYEHTALNFDTLDETSAAALAGEFFDWMEAFVAEHEAAGRTVGIYHWTTPETTRAMKMLGPERAARLFDGRFVDLKRWMDQRYVARDGFSLKKVAPLFGFKWDAEDAGGATSIIKIEEARQTDDPALAAAAREWLLTYNEDDCAAQAAIRDGLHEYIAAATIPA